MSTQQESPIADLMEDLGMSEVSTNDETQEDLNLNDSTDESTQTDDNETSDNKTEEENTSTAEKDDTEDSEILARLKELEKNSEIADKRLTDKDKYINELKKQIDELSGSKDKPEEVEESTEEDFWDNPEGYIKKIMETNNGLQEQLRIANLRIDEQSYAQDKKDYFELVNADNLKVEFAKDSKFLEDFNTSNEPYKVAYEYMKGKQDKSSASEAELREKLKAELLAELGLDKKNKKSPPSINNLGGSSSDKKDLPEDGFASVFGTN